MPGSKKGHFCNVYFEASNINPLVQIQKKWCIWIIRLVLFTIMTDRDRTVEKCKTTNWNILICLVHQEFIIMAKEKSNYHDGQDF